MDSARAALESAADNLTSFLKNKEIIVKCLSKDKTEIDKLKKSFTNDDAEESIKEYLKNIILSYEDACSITCSDDTVSVAGYNEALADYREKEKKYNDDLNRSSYLKDDNSVRLMPRGGALAKNIALEHLLKIYTEQNDESKNNMKEDLVVFIDPEDYLSPTYFKNIVDGFQSNQGCLIQPTINTASETDGELNLNDLSNLSTKKGDFESLLDVDGCNGIPFKFGDLISCGSKFSNKQFYK